METWGGWFVIDFWSKRRDGQLSHLVFFGLSLATAVGPGTGLQRRYGLGLTCRRVVGVAAAVVPALGISLAVCVMGVVGVALARLIVVVSDGRLYGSAWELSAWNVGFDEGGWVFALMLRGGFWGTALRFGVIISSVLGTVPSSLYVLHTRGAVRVFIATRGVRAANRRGIPPTVTPTASAS